jgi:hypothetical protein
MQFVEVAALNMIIKILKVCGLGSVVAGNRSLPFSVNRKTPSWTLDYFWIPAIR